MNQTYPVYKKQVEHHFYKQVSENKVIHVVFVNRDCTVKSEQPGVTLYTDYTKNTALINNLERFPFDTLLPCSVEEFNNALIDAMNELELIEIK